MYAKLNYLKLTYLIEYVINVELICQTGADSIFANIFIGDEHSFWAFFYPYILIYIFAVDSGIQFVTGY